MYWRGSAKSHKIIGVVEVGHQQIERYHPNIEKWFLGVQIWSGVDMYAEGF